MLPRGTDSPLPCVVEFVGYGGGRSFPYDWLVWSSCGHAHFVMDTRGQGSNKEHGDTPDVEPAPTNSQAPGFLTRGILSPETYYYPVFLLTPCAQWKPSVRIRCWTLPKSSLPGEARAAGFRWLSLVSTQPSPFPCQMSRF